MPRSPAQLEQRAAEVVFLQVGDSGFGPQGRGEMRDRLGQAALPQQDVAEL